MTIDVILHGSKEKSMGKYLIKQKVFSFTDTYDVYDEYGNTAYYVKAEFFSIGHRIHIYDIRTDREVGYIQQKIIALTPTFEIYMGGYSCGRIKKKITLFRPKYEVEMNNWFVEGDFFGWNYSVFAGNYEAARISKELFRWGDTYVVEFANDKDGLKALILAIAIDAAVCSNSDNNNSFM